jgi:hypothetical protein
VRELQAMGGLPGIMPSDDRGVVVTAIDTATYLAKMGLEVTSVGKRGRGNGHYTHWQIAHHAAAGEQWAQRLWSEHASAMLGRRQLTWSRGGRALVGLDRERSDETLASELTPEPGEVETPLLQIEPDVWDAQARAHRQLWVASLHDRFEADLLSELGQPLQHGSRELRPPVPEIAPVWWERQRAESERARKGAEWFHGASSQLEQGGPPRSPKVVLDKRDRQVREQCERLPWYREQREAAVAQHEAALEAFWDAPRRRTRELSRQEWLDELAHTLALDVGLRVQNQGNRTVRLAPSLDTHRPLQVTFEPVLPEHELEAGLCYLFTC